MRLTLKLGTFIINLSKRLSETVDIEDAKEALRLVKEALHSYAIDPLTGKIDMDLINTGKSSVWRENMQELKRQLRFFIEGADRKIMDIQSLVTNFKIHSSLVQSLDSLLFLAL